MDYDIKRCAQYHVDRHCVKMILETTQLLNNALIKHDRSYIPVYRETHKNHPCSIWASESVDNFIWLSNLGLALSKEYSYRYNKVHKCDEIIFGMRNSISINKIPKLGLTDFKKCMPDEYKTEDIVSSYRNYYLGSKRHLAKWTKRDIPDWWKL